LIKHLAFSKALGLETKKGKKVPKTVFDDIFFSHMKKFQNLSNKNKTQNKSIYTPTNSPKQTKDKLLDSFYPKKLPTKSRTNDHSILKKRQNIQKEAENFPVPLSPKEYSNTVAIPSVQKHQPKTPPLKKDGKRLIDTNVQPPKTEHKTDFPTYPKYKSQIKHQLQLTTVNSTQKNKNTKPVQPPKLTKTIPKETNLSVSFQFESQKITPKKTTNPKTKIDTTYAFYQNIDTLKKASKETQISHKLSFGTKQTPYYKTSFAQPSNKTDIEHNDKKRLPTIKLTVSPSEYIPQTPYKTRPENLPKEKIDNFKHTNPVNLSYKISPPKQKLNTQKSYEKNFSNYTPLTEEKVHKNEPITFYTKEKKEIKVHILREEETKSLQGRESVEKTIQTKLILDKENSPSFPKQKNQTNTDFKIIENIVIKDTKHEKKIEKNQKPPLSHTKAMFNFESTALLERTEVQETFQNSSFSNQDTPSKQYLSYDEQLFEREEITTKNSFDFTFSDDKVSVRTIMRNNYLKLVLNPNFELNNVQTLIKDIENILQDSGFSRFNVVLKEKPKKAYHSNKTYASRAIDVKV